MKTGILALVSYWLLFVILPTLAIIFFWGFSRATILAGVGILLILLVIGERGFRLWKHLWRIT